MWLPGYNQEAHETSGSAFKEEDEEEGSIVLQMAVLKLVEAAAVKSKVNVGLHWRPTAPLLSPIQQALQETKRSVKDLVLKRPYPQNSGQFV